MTSGICLRLDRKVSETEFALCSRLGCEIADRIAASRFHAKTTINHQPIVPCSTFGTELRAAVEKEIDRELSCGDCIGYLRNLNLQAEHDLSEIAQYLYANFPWPSAWRKRYATATGRRDRIAEILEALGPS